MKLRISIAAALVSLFASGCTFVHLNEEAEAVRLVTANEATYCKHLGKTTVSTLARIAGMPRHDESIRDELITLARNSAVNMKGDAIAPIGEVSEGRLAFNVYRCRGE